MRQVILASHGSLASGMLGTIEMILGKQENLAAYSLNPDGQTADLLNRIKQKIKESQAEETIIVTDLIGGSVHTALTSLVGQTGIHLLSGMNLSLLLELLLLPAGELQGKQIYDCMTKGREAILYMNDEVKKYEDEKEDDEWLNY